MSTYRKNNIWLPAHRLVVALPRKAACTTIKHLLWSTLGFPDLPEGESAHTREVPGQWHEIGTCAMPADCELIGVLRDPVPRLWSGWQQVCPNESTVEEWARFLSESAALSDAVMDEHVMPQAASVMSPTGQMPDSWLYVEHLAMDWSALCRRKAWPILPIPVKNPAPSGRPFQPESVTPAILELIWSRWARDCNWYETCWDSREAVREYASRVVA